MDALREGADRRMPHAITERESSKMSRVIYNMSASLDGFVRAEGVTPLGEGGEQLHQWFFDQDAVTRDYVASMLGSLGAVVAGRTTYDSSDWGPDGPTGARRIPTFVLTHHPPAAATGDNVYTFVTDGIVEAIAAARAAANGKAVSIMGGPKTGCQAIAAGLVDEIVVSIVPVLFGAGLPMFSELPSNVALDLAKVVDTKAAVHLTYRVLRS